MGEIGINSLLRSNTPPPTPPPQDAGRLVKLSYLGVIFVPDVAIYTLFRPQRIVIKLILLWFRRQGRFSKFPYFDIIYALRAAFFIIRVLKLPYMGQNVIHWQKVT